MIIEWAKTCRTVYIKNSFGGWSEDKYPEWLHDREYSFDHPKEKHMYRVALMRNLLAGAGCAKWTTTADNEGDEKEIQANEEFIKWLTDWQLV
jgi:hypothetical protein